MAQVVTLEWQLTRGDQEGAQVARREFGDEFARKYETEQDRPGAELVFGELVGNAVEHAKAVVTVTAVLDGVTMLTVRDDGAGFRWDSARTPAPNAERGRGLYIASIVAQELTVQRVGDKSVVTALLRPSPRAASEK